MERARVEKERIRMLEERGTIITTSGDVVDSNQLHSSAAKPQRPSAQKRSPGHVYQRPTAASHMALPQEEEDDTLRTGGQPHYIHEEEFDVEGRESKQQMMSELEHP